MKELTVVLYGVEGNNAVLRMPGRKFPGILLQGDTLKNLLDTSRQVVDLAKKGGNDDLVDEAEGLSEMILEIYEAYVREIELPS